MNPSIDKLNVKLIKKVLDDDKSAILEFINLSEPLIWGALYKYDQFSDLEREDLFQDIFVKLFSNDKKRIRMWQGKAKFSTYLYMVTVNSALDYLKSSGYVKAKNYDSIENINDQSHFVNFADLDNSAHFAIWVHFADFVDFVHFVVLSMLFTLQLLSIL